MKTKHILLTTDLSEEAQRAFRPVANLAKTIDAKVTLLHVVQVLTSVAQGSMLGTPISPGNVAGELEGALRALEGQVELFGETEVAVDAITADNVARAIVDYADKHEAGLIALSTHGRSGLRRMVLGSVAEEVLRHSHIPVLSFPPQKQK